MPVIDYRCQNCEATDFRVMVSPEPVICSECGGIMVFFDPFEEKNHPVLISLAWLINRRACQSGLSWFRFKFKKTYVPINEVFLELRKSRQDLWIRWLQDRLDEEGVQYADL